MLDNRGSFTHRRELSEYPTGKRRIGHLALVTAVTVAGFYQVYVQGSVAPQIIHEYGMTLQTYTLTGVVGGSVGALAALFSGLSDRWGRANLVVVAAGLASVLTLFVVPHAGSAAAYIALYGVLSLVDGVVLVTTATMIRDFSPQLGRATAMGVWTVGPALANLLLTAIASRTLPHHPDWRYQYYICGTVGAVAFVLVALLLREVAPALRNQTIVRLRERALLQARAADPEITTDTGARVWRASLVVPAIGIGVFLVFYYTRIGYFALYFQANFGYSPSRSNALSAWYWVPNIVALVLAGYVSDRLRVRKPVMIAGALISAFGLVLFASRTTEHATGYYTFAGILALIAVGGAMVNTTWLAAFSESVEAVNPAASGRGMAVYGSVVRISAVLTYVFFGLLVTAPSQLANYGPTVAVDASTYHSELATLAALRPETRGALVAHPTSPETLRAAGAELAGAAPTLTPAQVSRAVAQAAAVPPSVLTYLSRHGAAVTKAVNDQGGQWSRWWWICLVGQLGLIPLALPLRGRWRQRDAKADLVRHDAATERALAELTSTAT